MEEWQLDNEIIQVLRDINRDLAEITRIQTERALPAIRRFNEQSLRARHDADFVRHLFNASADRESSIQITMNDNDFPIPPSSRGLGLGPGLLLSQATPQRFCFHARVQSR